MKLSLVIWFAIISLFIIPKQVESIYIGKSFFWTVYYDASKSDTVIEISGIKYGHHDYLIGSGASDSDTIAISKVGRLFKKNGKLYYCNKELNFEVQLKEQEYSSRIDSRRKKLFEIKAFYEVSRLKDSLKVEYKFNWNVDKDYEYYRDSRSLPEDYVPEYLKAFFKRRPGILPPR